MNYKSITKRLVCLFFITLMPLLLLTKSSVITLEKKLEEQAKIVTTRFEQQLSELFKSLETQASIITEEPLFKELQNALRLLEEEPDYKSYKLLVETLALIDEIQSYNYAITHSDLLQKTTACLEKIPTDATTHSLRSVLKKQRVALIELSDEKDLIESNKKNLAIYYEEFSMALEKNENTLRENPAFIKVQQIQSKYLQVGSVKKAQALIDKIYVLQTQQEMALLKNKPYQQLLHSLKQLEPNCKKPLQTCTTETSLVVLQKQLYLIPLSSLI